MNAQSVFDKVAGHLLTQNARSVSNGGSCKYRNESGLMCAVGCLIPTEVYTVRMEGRNVGILIDQYFGLPSWFQENENMLFALQNVHDDIDPTQWRAELAEVADRFDLKFNH